MSGMSDSSYDSDEMVFEDEIPTELLAQIQNISSGHCVVSKQTKKRDDIDVVQNMKSAVEQVKDAEKCIRFNEDFSGNDNGEGTSKCQTQAVNEGSIKF